ncbi:MAG: T9SS type A sorting domain-containing protein [Ignavibacteria bacterium]|nr:T9SS type A sorting domain-containing protein [Ignavibacteria bacterium]
MKTTLYLFVAFLFAANIVSSAPVSDSCLRMYLPHNPGFDTTTGNSGTYNPDSVMIDTCSGSATYNHKYAKRMFRIQFPIYFYPFDHVLDSGEVKGVSDIDSTYLGLKNRFLEIQDTFGIIYFQGLNHFSSDSIVLLNPVLQVFFEEYQDIDFIVQHFTNTIDSIVKVVYNNRAGNPIGVNEKSETSNFSIYPNPVNDYLTISYKIGRSKDKIEIISIDGKKYWKANIKRSMMFRCCKTVSMY